MAMRLRQIEGFWVAVCAAKTDPQAGDIYLDDAQDHAIRSKLSHDYRSEGYDLPRVDLTLDNLMLAEESQ